MDSLLRRFFLLLLLGHHIDGVNRETVEDDSSEASTVSEPLSFESMKILDYHDKMLLKEERQTTSDDDFIAASFLETNESYTSICTPHDSCIDRCGEEPRDLPYTCHCDHQCVHFSDCCFDYEQQCKHKPNNTLAENSMVNIPRLSCEILFMKYNLLVVSECPRNYGNVRIKRLCSTELPKDCFFSDNVKVSDAADVHAKCYKSVYDSCLARMKKHCNAKVEPQCNSAMTRECSKIASNKCHKCDKSYWPVVGDSKILYRNSFCALCNEKMKYKVLSPHYLANISKDNKFIGYENLLARPCVPVDIDSCPRTEISQEIKTLCHNYSGAVLANSKKKTIYKNKHCAKCHGENTESLKCATKRSLMKGLIGPLLDKFITGEEQGMQFDDIPAAFSILLNFGLDGRERMYFSSEGEKEMKRLQERCGDGMIWDPFSEVCRRLYCSTEFVLVDYKCVRRETAKEEPTSGNVTSVIPDAKSDFVHLTLTAEVEVIDFLQFNGQDIDAICESIRESLANSFSININRIENVHFNISLGEFSGLNDTLRFLEDMTDLHPIAFKIEFDLYEEHMVNVTAASEPSVDSIVSMLASSLSINGFEFDINNITSRIFEIHQTVSPLMNWCSSDSGGQKREYWNSEFSLVMNEDNSTSSSSPIKGIFVNKTGKFYSHGKFVADILFQGYQFSNSLINVSGVAVVCDRRIMMDESCIRILVAESEYSISDNGSLHIHNESLRNVVDYSSYEIAENNSVLVCIDRLKTMGYFERYRMRPDVVESMVSLVLLWVSVIALALVLVTYLSFESLRNLPGCNTMNLTFSMMIMQIIFLFGLRGKVTGTSCVVVGHFFHYLLLCCFMWMNVMAFDLFRTFGNKNILSNIRSKRKYLPLYSIYAYVSPITVMITSSLLDYYSYDSMFAPRYGMDNLCWITNRLAAIVFFAVPLAVIMLVNFVFFLLTILAMRSVKSLSHLRDHQTSRGGKNDVFLYAKMALVIGLTWAVSFAAASVSHNGLAGQVLTYLFIVCNTLQGVFVFWAFVCNKKVLELYREAFRSLRRKVYKQAKYESSSETISRLALAMKRSVSNNTVVSTLSNASASSNEVHMSQNK